MWQGWLSTRCTPSRGPAYQCRIIPNGSFLFLFFFLNETNFILIRKKCLLENFLKYKKKGF